MDWQPHPTNRVRSAGWDRVGVRERRRGGAVWLDPGSKTSKTVRTESGRAHADIGLRCGCSSILAS